MYLHHQHPKDKNSGKLSELTGSTRESKVNRYVAKAVKEVAAQYIDTIPLEDADIGTKEDKIS